MIIVSWLLFLADNKYNNISFYVINNPSKVGFPSYKHTSSKNVSKFLIQCAGFTETVPNIMFSTEVPTENIYACINISANYHKLLCSVVPLLPTISFNNSNLQR